MLIEKTYVKDMDELSKNVIAKAFESCDVVAENDPNSLESAPVTLIRVLGKKYWCSSDYDIINITTQDQAAFNRGVIQQDMTLASMISQYIAFLFQGYMEINGKQEFTKEFYENIENESKSAKLTAYLNNGSVCKTSLYLKDLKDVTEFTNDGLPRGIVSFTDIMNISMELQKIVEEIKHTNPTDPKYKSLQTARIESAEKLAKLHYDICDKFFTIIETQCKIKIDDVFDICIGFGSTVTDKAVPGGSYKALSVAQLHSMAYRNIMNLKSEYGVL